jgi:hypothetical protein
MSTSREDVLHVAEYMHMKPTEEQIQYCIDEFDRRADEDPTGYWEIWIEDLLLEQDVSQNPPPEKFRFFLYDMTTGEMQLDLGEITEEEAENYEDGSLRAIKEKEHVINLVIAEMRRDFDNGDVTAIDELLGFLSIDKLKAYLPEEGI